MAIRPVNLSIYPSHIRKTSTRGTQPSQIASPMGRAGDGAAAFGLVPRPGQRSDVD
ncbi:hypothetical protein Ga0080574_TMP4654 [Salipiger abyssi]|uniref:Uncharacterized protein n=1 Tax=Salipiger abyssi TaxID=1250539 RepID=A0A1P8V033_9RHOB|nr:hypothetical protein Ga0080574_TMP4654 [Salipiger abyssi]